MTQQYPMMPPPQKKKHTALFITLGVIALVCCGGGGIAALVSTGESETSTAGTSSGGGGEAPKNDKKAAGLNTPARDGKFEFVIESVACGKPTVGGQYLKATAQGQFCSVSMSVKNVGKEAQLLDSSGQKAFSADGSTYSADATATLYANEQNQFFVNQINPGNTVKGVLIYDIPAGGAITKFELHDSPFSGGVTVVP